MRGIWRLISFQFLKTRLLIVSFDLLLFLRAARGFLIFTKEIIGDFEINVNYLFQKNKIDKKSPQSLCGCGFYWLLKFVKK